VSKQKKICDVLAAAREEDAAISIRRGSKRDESIEGFVAAVGRKWVLVAPMTTGGFLDGYAVIRLTDIRRARPYTSWERRFSLTRPEWPPRPPSDRPPLDLDSTSGMLATFLEPGILLSIERKRKDAMWVGVPDELTRRWLYLSEVDSDAVWDDAPRGYRLRTITLVRTGDRYLRGLTAIAGHPPAEELPHHWAARSRTARRR
jgi:hypothetical protein